MASGKDRQSPIQGLPPPPVAAPRRRSPVCEMAMPAPKESSSAPSWSLPVAGQRSSFGRFGGPEDETDFGLRTSLDTESSRRTCVGKSQSMFTSESVPFVPPSPEDLRFSQPLSTGNHPDLVGLDFSGTLSRHEGESRPHSASLEDLKYNQRAVYPDIRQAFQEVTPTQTPVSPPYPTFSQMSQPHPHIRVVSCSTPPPIPSYAANNFGWNNSLLNTSSSVLSGYSAGAYPPTCQPFMSRMDNSRSYSSRPENILQGNDFSGNLNAGNTRPNSLGQTAPRMQHLTTSAAYDLNPLSGGTPYSINYVPNISLSRPSSSNDVLDSGRESSQSPTDNRGIPPSVVAGLDENFLAPGQNLAHPGDENLIKLGQGLPEHEYLSLDYFDPLYSRARKESVSYGSGRVSAETNFSFGEAFPNLYEDHPAAYEQQSEDSVWLPSSRLAVAQEQQQLQPVGFEAFDFDAFGPATFGQSEEEFLKDSTSTTPAFVTAAYDASPPLGSGQKLDEKPQRPLSSDIPKVSSLFFFLLSVIL